MSEPVRVQLLQEAIRLTSGDRHKSYGEPIVNLGLAGKMKQLFREHTVRKIGPAEQEAIDMMLTKISRLAAGDRPGRDTFVDGAAYFSLAGEVMEQEAG